MSASTSIVTVHMAASLDGFIARRDGRVDWMQASNTFEGGIALTADDITAFLGTIDCYVMGSRTYERALSFVAEGAGWAYGQTPIVVLTHRSLPERDAVTFYAGDLGQLLKTELKPRYRRIWCVGGSAVAAAFLQQGLADEVHVSLLPVVIGSGQSLFEGLDADVSLHLHEVKAYRHGIVDLRYRVSRQQ